MNTNIIIYVFHTLHIMYLYTLHMHLYTFHTLHIYFMFDVYIYTEFLSAVDSSK